MILRYQNEDDKIFGFGLTQSYRGSTVALMNNAGVITDTFKYGPYGELLEKRGSSKTIFLYVGQYGVQNDDNGLLYMRARYYNTDIRRFLNIDPIKDGWNWYIYSSGNPILYIDPSGHKAAYREHTGGGHVSDKSATINLQPAVGCIDGNNARNLFEPDFSSYKRNFPVIEGGKSTNPWYSADWVRLGIVAAVAVTGYLIFDYFATNLENAVDEWIKADIAAHEAEMWLIKMKQGLTPIPGTVSN